MKLSRLEGIETSEKWMLDLQWNIQELEKAKDILMEWDERDLSYYKNIPKYMQKIDLAEREHLRNSIKFWEEKLTNETRSS